MRTDSLHRWPRRVELAVIAVAMLACLLPFVDKAYHIDDTLFVWAGQHIRYHPVDFYGFNVHWYDTWHRMSDVTQNPPMTCYYLALAGPLGHWSEVGLHLAMLIPTWMCLWGTYRLAERFGVRPLPATLLVLFTPVILVSASSVMCDVMMLAFWLWTIIAWDRGLRERSMALLCLGGALIAMTALTKYFGICLIPLLGVYSFAIDRAAWRKWAAGLGVAVLMLAAYQAVFMGLYFTGDWQRVGGLAGAMGYAANVGAGSWGGKLFRGFEGLAFIGGCFGIGAIASIALLPRRCLPIVGIGIVATILVSLYLGTTSELSDGELLADSPYCWDKDAWLGPRPDLIAQFVVWVAAGIALLALTVHDLATRRDAISLLMALWVFGTAVFAAYVNWTLNARSVLPIVPAAAFIIVRRAEEFRLPRWTLPAVLAPAAALAMIVTMSDAGMANANREGAQAVIARYPPGGSRPLWFSGHWGFQYYIQQAGAVPWDFNGAEGKAGDRLVIPLNNYYSPAPELPENRFARRIDSIESSTCNWAATTSPDCGAGFYACTICWRPLPFVFARIPPERFQIFELTKDQTPQKK